MTAASCAPWAFRPGAAPLSLSSVLVASASDVVEPLEVPVVSVSCPVRPSAGLLGEAVAPDEVRVENVDTPLLVEAELEDGVKEDDDTVVNDENTDEEPEALEGVEAEEAEAEAEAEGEDEDEEEVAAASPAGLANPGKNEVNGLFRD